MNKKRIIKLSEEMIDEIINSDGQTLNGRKIEFPGNSIVRTTTYDNKKDGQVYDTDDHVYLAVEPPYYTKFGGYSSYSASAFNETYNIIDDGVLEEEDIFGKRNDDSDFVSKYNQEEISSEIDNIDSLVGLYYDASDLKSSVDKLVSTLKGFENDEKFNDLIAISLKEILLKINFSVLTSTQKRELINLLNNG